MKLLQARCELETHRRLRQMSVDTGDSMRTLVGVAVSLLLEAHEAKKQQRTASNNGQQDQEQDQYQEGHGRA